MARYYYFAATLPTPQMGSPPPMTSGDYRARCALHLASRDYELVASTLLASPPEGQPAATRPSAPITTYYAWERTLRNELARLRARRLEREAESWIRPADRDDTAARTALSIFGAANPLEAELYLERERWALLRSLDALHFFDLDHLALYHLELQILERLGRLEQTAGVESYHKTYAAILGGSESSGTGVEA